MDHISWKYSSAYVPDDYISLDEQLVRHRGRILGRTYMPFKPGKYELKIFWACKTSAGYTLYAITYNGKEGDQLYKNFVKILCLDCWNPTTKQEEMFAQITFYQL